MTVTILIAPAGQGVRPVKFKPAVHCFSVPEGEESADLAERFTLELSEGYHSPVYTWESVNATPALMGKFERYVSVCEAERIRALKAEGILQSYRVASKACSTGVFWPLVNDFCAQLQAVFPGVSAAICRAILQESNTGCGVVHFNEYRRILAYNGLV